MVSLDAPLLELAPIAIIGFGAVATWTYVCLRAPLPAFAVLLFLTVTTNDRLRSGYFLGGEGQGHGSISLVDLVWLVYVAVLSLRALQQRPVLMRNPRLPFAVWIGLPYLVMSVALPVLGGLAGFATLDWPITYVSTGLRQLQWMSFAGIAYWLAMQFGVHSTAITALRSFTAAGIAHATYGLVQLGVRSDTLPQAWRAFDDFYASGGADWLTHSARLTGLYVMPTPYGNLGALLCVVGLALVASRLSIGRLAWLLAAFGTGGFMVLMSGDRVALVGLVCALLVASLVSIASSFRITRLVVLAPLLPLAVVAMAPLFPAFVQRRLAQLLESTSHGVWSIPNVAGRLEHWTYYFNVVMPSYPIGTWVQPRFVGGMTPDSYIVTVLAQGSVVYLIAFASLICGLVLLGLSLLAPREAKAARWLGVLLTGITAFVSVAALGGSVMFDVTVLVLLWTFAGIATLETRQARRRKPSPTAAAGA